MGDHDEYVTLEVKHLKKRDHWSCDVCNEDATTMNCWMQSKTNTRHYAAFCDKHDRKFHELGDNIEKYYMELNVDKRKEMFKRRPDRGIMWR